MGPQGNDANTTNQAQNKSTPWLTLEKSMSSMAGGDTLIILDGVYTGTKNVINQTAHPPNGSPDSYTIIKAENEGNVLFDGENIQLMFNLNGGGPCNYIEFRGLKWGNTRIGYNNGPAVLITYLDHCKFFRCGAFQAADGNASAWNITYSSYLLFEECYGWGSGRYKFIAFNCDYIVFRRCVGRNDAINTNQPIAVFQDYVSRHVEFQNCIAADSNIIEFLTGGTTDSIEGSFTTHPPTTVGGQSKSTDNGFWRGCISINEATHAFTTSPGSTNLTIEDFVVWKADQGIRGNGDTTVSIRNATIGNIACNNIADVTSCGHGVYNWNSAYGIYNSIIYNASNYGLRGVAASDYNLLYGNTIDYLGVTPGANDLSVSVGQIINPLTGVPGNGNAALKYPIRIEGNSDIGGADIGATVMTKTGASGTLYGETGYNTDTGEALWPFPYEEQIRADMRTYNPGGGDATMPDGRRGFCADGTGLYGGPITLTSYIWECLGNPLPPEIYGPPASPDNLRVQ